MKIYLASDHAGYALKEYLRRHLEGPGFEIEDCGAFSFDPNDDYPKFIRLAARGVANDPERHKAIILGGSGEGEAMVANRYKGVRATVFYGGSMDIIKLSREHNDANVLSLGAQFLNIDEVKRAIDLFIETKFEGGRHQRRIEKVSKLENS